MASKPALGLLLTGKPKGESMPEESEPEDEMADERRSAARGLIKAIEAGDADMVASAFESLLATCDDSYAAQSGDGDEELDD